jgi:hypothetical protein
LAPLSHTPLHGLSLKQRRRWPTPWDAAEIPHHGATQDMDKFDIIEID